ncbi:unnamed protein product [Euphydryas editha]|uniref:Uncharacterized protein n=1 Tax=Euphydryas editha TaxID=104508 RepID=A0AAU9U385_EUPED|nr:unnamed protein product [Euphydryas editha]
MLGVYKAAVVIGLQFEEKWTNDKFKYYTYTSIYLLVHSTRAASHNIKTTLGARSTSHTTRRATFAVSRWLDHFRSGDRSLENQPRSGRPLAVNDDDLRRELQLIPDAITCDLAEASKCSYHAVKYHLPELGHRKVLARWVPHIFVQSVSLSVNHFCCDPDVKSFCLIWLLTTNHGFITITIHVVLFGCLEEKRHQLNQS